MSQTGPPVNRGKSPHVSPVNSSRGRGPSRCTLGDNAVTTEESLLIAKRFVMNQPVRVNIEGCGWVLGTVVLLVKTMQSLTGSTVKVRYSLPTERNEKESEVPNHPDYIRPLKRD